jgi:hypothetical protein
MQDQPRKAGLGGYQTQCCQAVRWRYYFQPAANIPKRDASNLSYDLDELQNHSVFEGCLG